MKFARGNITQEMRIIGDTDRHGTIVTFKPDPEMFDTLTYDYETLHTRMREQAFLNAGLRIEIADRRTEDGPSDSMCYEGGIREFVTLAQPPQDAPARGGRLYGGRSPRRRGRGRSAVPRRL